MTMTNEIMLGMFLGLMLGIAIACFAFEIPKMRLPLFTRSPKAEPCAKGHLDAESISIVGYVAVRCFDCGTKEVYEQRNWDYLHQNGLTFETSNKWLMGEFEKKRIEEQRKKEEILQRAFHPDPAKEAAAALSEWDQRHIGKKE